MTGLEFSAADLVILGAVAVNLVLSLRVLVLLACIKQALRDHGIECVDPTFLSLGTG